MFAQNENVVGVLSSNRKPVGLRHWLIVLAVFCIAGTVTTLFSRFLLTGIMHLEGTMWSGPWSYRIAYLLLIPPFYSVSLLSVGTLFGKHAYFKRRLLRIWGRPLGWLLHRRLGIS